jgi:hypothetical protein
MTVSPARLTSCLSWNLGRAREDEIRIESGMYLIASKPNARQS